MFPWLAHGHVFSFLELAKELSRRNFHIYFCSTPINLESVKVSLEKNLVSDIAIELIELHLPSLPELPPHCHTTKNISTDLIPTLIKTLQMSRSSFSDIIDDVKPDLLIYDAFQPWAAELASSLGIPSVYYATSGAAPFSFFHHRIKYKDEPFPYPALYIHDYESKDYDARKKSVKVRDFDKDFVSVIVEHSGIVLMRTSRVLEGKYIGYFSSLCERTIVPVGASITKSNSEHDPSKIMQWLDKKSPSSTAYISFGSENYLSKEQMAQMAHGLEISNVNFIWVIRSPVGEIISIEVLPKGFLDRVKETGMVVQGWAPQAEILAHSSTGGFMSHCGWSSIMESVYFGVPVIAMPLKLDQPINARLLVEAGVAVEVVRDDNGEFIGEEVAKAMRNVVVKGEGLRFKAWEWSEMMKSEEKQAMDDAARQLSLLCMKKKVPQ